MVQFTAADNESPAYMEDIKHQVYLSLHSRIATKKCFQLICTLWSQFNCLVFDIWDWKMHTTIYSQMSCQTIALKYSIYYNAKKGGKFWLLNLRPETVFFFFFLKQKITNS